MTEHLASAPGSGLLPENASWVVVIWHSIVPAGSVFRAISVGDGTGSVSATWNVWVHGTATVRWVGLSPVCRVYVMSARPSPRTSKTTDTVLSPLL
ncbi:hypothetical protein [Actinoplanes sp. NPDC026623]|uniref:hypothetical protein n=1 Tax=Actinoplanes sp. NPDC026623 TaxID=3155610 RepID=UPI0033DDB052